MQLWNATEIAAMQEAKQLFNMGCFKTHLTSGGDGGTVKMCMISPHLDRKDSCASGNYEGNEAHVCFCHSDKCNGAGGNPVPYFVLVSALSLLFVAGKK